MSYVINRDDWIMAISEYYDGPAPRCHAPSDFLAY